MPVPTFEFAFKSSQLPRFDKKLVPLLLPIIFKFYCDFILNHIATSFWFTHKSFHLSLSLDTISVFKSVCVYEYWSIVIYEMNGFHHLSCFMDAVNAPFCTKNAIKCIVGVFVFDFLVFRAVRILDCPIFSPILVVVFSNTRYHTIKVKTKKWCTISMSWTRVDTSFL